MNHAKLLGRLTTIAALLTVLAVGSVSSCATSHHRSKHQADMADLDAKSSKKTHNYSIIKPSQIDYSLLRKGQKTMYSSALDSY
jgi:hypothetical protein